MLSPKPTETLQALCISLKDRESKDYKLFFTLERYFTCPWMRWKTPALSCKLFPSI